MNLSSVTLKGWRVGCRFVVVFTWLCFERRCTHFQPAQNARGAHGLLSAVAALRGSGCTAWRSGGFHYYLCGRQTFKFVLPFLRASCRHCAKPTLRAVPPPRSSPITSLCVPNWEVILNEHPPPTSQNMSGWEGCSFACTLRSTRGNNFTNYKVNAGSTATDERVPTAASNRSSPDFCTVRRFGCSCDLPCIEPAGYGLFLASS